MQATDPHKNLQLMSRLKEYDMIGFPQALAEGVHQHADIASGVALTLDLINSFLLLVFEVLVGPFHLLDLAL
jgi:hypothetical protein